MRLHFQGSAHLLDVLNLAVLLAWPEDGNVKHQFARAIASRLLDPKQLPATRPKDGSYSCFTESMPTLGSFLNSKHGVVWKKAGASKLTYFIIKGGWPAGSRRHLRMLAPHEMRSSVTALAILIGRSC